MGRYARKKGKGTSCKGIGKRGGKTKTKTRDLDQINEDITKGVNPLPEDEIYCIECARSFQNQEILVKHLKSKNHKQRVKKLKDWPSDEC